MEFGHLPHVGSDPDSPNSGWFALTRDSAQGWQLLLTLSGFTEELEPKDGAMAFYEPRFSSKPKNGFYRGGEDAPAGFYDPWGSPFLVRLDHDGDGFVESGEVDAEPSRLKTGVLVVSVGSKDQEYVGDGESFRPTEKTVKSWE